MLKWLASLSPGRVAVLAFAWPITLVVITLVQIVSVLWPLSGGAVISIGFHPVPGAWVRGSAILGGPPLAILGAWLLARRSRE